MSIIGWNEEEEIKKAVKFIFNYRKRIGYPNFMERKNGELIHSKYEEADTCGPVEMASMVFFRYQMEVCDVIDEKPEVWKRLMSDFAKLNIYGDTLLHKTTRILLDKDVTKGVERIPIRLFGSNPHQKVTPDNYVYVKDTFMKEKFLDDAEDVKDFQICCDCPDSCLAETCPCYSVGMRGVRSKTSSLSYYSSHEGRLLMRNSMTYASTLLCCCGPLCKCHKNCSMRFKYLCNPHQLEVFHKNDILGFCVRTLSDIVFGEFVMEFSGEVASPEELHSDRDAVDYSIHLVSDDDHKLLRRIKTVTKNHISELTWKRYQLPNYYINPYYKGNVARFCSHSCFPNMTIVRVMVNDMRPHMHRLMLVSTANIPAGSEVSFDYGDAYFNRMGQCGCATIACADKRIDWMRIPLKERNKVFEKMNEKLRKRIQKHEEDRLAPLEIIELD